MATSFVGPLRGVRARIRVDLSSNVDPAALGCGLLDDSIAADAARGYPVCTVTVETPLRGYTAACGWIQLVRSSDGDDPETFAADPLSLHADLPTPYAFFGIAPTLFDAPFRPHRDDLTWRAHTFLCLSPDAVMSKRVEPVVGFAWGFDVADGSITLDGPRLLPGSAWATHAPTLQRTYPAWEFASVGPHREWAPAIPDGGSPVG